MRKIITVERAAQLDREYRQRQRRKERTEVRAIKRNGLVTL